MTDERVKEAVERLSKGLDAWCVYSGGVTFPGDADVRIADIRAILADNGALQAERDKLAAENDALDAALERSNKELFADKAKLTALVEAAQPVVDCWGVGTLNITAMCEFVDALRQAIAHHSAPVGEAEGSNAAEAWSDLAPGRRFGRRLTADAVETLERGTLLRFHSDDPWFDHSGDMPKYGEIVRFTGNVGRAFPLVGDHLEVQALNGRVYPGGGWVFRLFQFVAPPSTPTSAPVEDVGERETAAFNKWSRDTIQFKGPTAAQERAFRSGYRAAALIQPQGEERG